MLYMISEKSRRMIDELVHYVIFEPYSFVLDLKKCEGMWLVTVDGNRIFDWAGFYGSKLIGINHPRLYEPDYIERLCVAANNKIANPDFPTQECLDYYRLLFKLAPQCMKNPRLEVYVVNSGAEAVENMLKYMINFHQQKLLAKMKTPKVRRFIYFDEAFHGRTVFALNVTRLSTDPVLTKGFHGFASGNIQIPFPAVDSDQPRAENDAITAKTLKMIEGYLSQYQDEIVGIIVEPIQGAGGHRMARPEFFRGLSRLAAQYDVPLGFDEVQTAGGQTGSPFMIDHLDLPYPPQAVAVAKKFGNGVVYMQHSMEDKGVLDSTWGGNLADMVRFVQEWGIVCEEKLIEQVPEKAKALVNVLCHLKQKYPHLIYNIRGMGLYQGFSLRNPGHKSKLINDALENENLLILGAGNESIRLRPNLNVTGQDIDLLAEKLDKCLAHLEK